jgi:N-acetylglucosaminyl-diphospho-decaprenol L-rhamnosyltransferase
MESVDVIIVTYGSAALIPSCLASLWQSDRVSRVVVVDNASDDGSAEAARRAGAAVVIQNDCNLGFARAVNIGLAEVADDLVLLLNPDARLSAEALTVLCEDFAADPAVAVAGPLLRADDCSVTAGAGRTATLAGRVGQCVPVVGRSRRLRPEYALPRDPGALGRPVDVGYLYGAAMLVDRRFLTACGGLDERFFLFAEDEDLCRRARAAGSRVLLDGRAVAEHVGGASCPDVPLTEAQRLFSTWRLFEKWEGRSHAAVYHRGIQLAFAARAAAAALDPAGRGAVRCTSRLFDEAVRTGVDPLVASGAGWIPPSGTAAASGPSTGAGAGHSERSPQ